MSAHLSTPISSSKATELVVWGPLASTVCYSTQLHEGEGFVMGFRAADAAASATDLLKSCSPACACMASWQPPQALASMQGALMDSGPLAAELWMHMMLLMVVEYDAPCLSMSPLWAEIHCHEVICTSCSMAMSGLCHLMHDKISCKQWTQCSSPVERAMKS